MTTVRKMAELFITVMTNRMIHTYRSTDDQTDDEDVKDKVAIVTGGNTGIGRSVVTTLVKRGAVVVMACRDVVKGQKLVDDIKTRFPDSKLIMIKLDLSNLASVRTCAAEICGKFEKIHLLINNAGYMSNRALERIEGSGLEKHLVTNHLGHFLLTMLLLKKLANGAPSRIVNVGSTAMDLNDLNLDDFNMEVDTRMGFSNIRPYGNSKWCMLLCTKELANRLQGTQIRTYYLCPGAVDTGLAYGLIGFLGLVAPLVLHYAGATEDQGSETVLYCALSKDTASESGKPYHYRKYWASMDQKFDAHQAAKVWTLSENYVDVKFSDVFSK